MKLYDDFFGGDSEIGNWTILGPAFGIRKGRRKPVVVCQCKCGRVEIVDAYNLRKKNSLGCARCGHTKTAAKKVKHGRSRTRVHNIWWGMIVRCTNPNVECWDDYGGRGIHVCDRWRNSFEAFLEDMGEPPTPKHTIERIEANGNYEPGNCKWATGLEQARNKRNGRIVEYKGKQFRLHELSEATGVSVSILKDRILRGWSIERAVEQPIRNQRANRHAAASSN